MSEQVKATKTETTMRADSELGDEGTRDLADVLERADLAVRFCSDRSADAQRIFQDDIPRLVGELEAARTELAQLRDATNELVNEWDRTAEKLTQSPHFDTRSVGARTGKCADQLREVLRADRRVG